jgi:uncharacterized membrane protein
MRVRPWPITLSLRSLASPLYAVLLLLLLPHPARADLRLCDRTSYVLETASSTIRNTDSLTQGWTRIIPGDCATVIKGRLGAASYLVYARSSLAHAGPAHAWGGAFPVCVKDGDFVLHQTVTQAYCTAPDTFDLPFAPVNFRGRRDWTMDFDESPALRSLTAAQLAGVKRLLTDNGYKPGAIDGSPNKLTAAALTDFRAKMKFKPQDGNDVLFAALERQAETRSAPQGYAVCNDTPDPLLAAIAENGPGQPRSRGWWRVAPKSCARAIATPLTGPVYLLAQKLNGAVVVGGGEKFCTTSIIFDIEGRGDCATRGLAESGFAVTVGSGATGYVAHVGDKGIAR